MARHRRQNSHTLDDLLECTTAIFEVIPAWISIPVALVGGVAIDIFWTLNISSIPGLNKIGWMLGALFALIILLGGFLGHRNRRHREGLVADTIGIPDLKRLSWQDFEKLVAEFYRQGGYSVEETGGGGADGGIDLVLWKNGQKTIVQCKHWKTYKVGVEKVRELYGVQTSENAVQAILITSGTFTQEALNFAQGKPLELIDGAQCAGMARQLQSTLASTKTAVSNIQARETAEIHVPQRPECPSCKTTMILRRAKRGNSAGSNFWGCINFPKCRCTQPVG